MAKIAKWNLSTDGVLYEKGKVYPDSILEDGRLDEEAFDTVSDAALEVATEEAATEGDAPKKPARKSSKKTPEGSLE